MQTFGVHMRSPAATLEETGIAGFLAFQAYFAGIIISSLAHPVFYVILAFEAANGTLFEKGSGLKRKSISLFGGSPISWGDMRQILRSAL